jgi:hypothetical protein
MTTNQYGIERMAGDRALLEGEYELEGVCVAVWMERSPDTALLNPC